MSTTPMPRIPANALVMVADGNGARLFRNAGTDLVNVLFRRPDGHLGLIEPDA